MQVSAEDIEKGCCGIPGIPPASFFKALCEPTRMSILLCLALCEDTQTVSQLAAEQTVDMSVVSRHLRALRDAGIVEAEKRGKETHYKVDCQRMTGLLRQFADAIEKCCGGQC